MILERTPPELGADIFRHGIYLTGGASQVSHFAERVQQATGLKVNLAERPMESVVLGMARILKDEKYKSVGGASQVSHFAERVQQATGLKVNLAERPMESVVLGMARILKDEKYKSVAYAIEGMGK